MRVGAIAAGLLLVLGLIQPAAAVTNAAVLPPDWPEESTFEFAILDARGNRQATAFYRILAEESEGRPTWHFKYMGKNEQLQESAECVAFRDTLQPLRSTRKVVSANRTFYQDIAYADGKVIIRSKYEGQEVRERELPIHPNTYDYEELIWLVGQLDFSQDFQLSFNLFSMLTEAQASLIITDTGDHPLTVNNYTYNSRLYSFDVNLTPYAVYTVVQDGIQIPARIDMGDTTFINMRIDSKKVTSAKPAATQQPEQKPEEQKPPASGPLGPPPPGGKF